MDWLSRGWEQLQHTRQLRWLQSLHWHRIAELSTGEHIAWGTLLVCVLLGGLAALDRLTASADLQNPDAPKKPKRRRKFDPRYLVLVLVALLPGGLVGSAAVVLAMGKAHWRRDAISIVAASLPVLWLLLWMRSSYFPLPQVAWNFYITGVFGIAFGLLHLWATVKLLREYWGEPLKKVPWYPPQALWLQSLLLGAGVYWLLFR